MYAGSDWSHVILSNSISNAWIDVLEDSSNSNDNKVVVTTDDDRNVMIIVYLLFALLFGTSQVQLCFVYCLRITIINVFLNNGSVVDGTSGK